MGRDGEFSQCNRSPMDHSSWACSWWAVTLGSLTCEEGGNLSTRDLGFIYVSSEGRVGCEFIHPAKPTDAPSSRRSSRSHFYTPGFPRGCNVPLKYAVKYENSEWTGYKQRISMEHKICHYIFSTKVYKILHNYLMKILFLNYKRYIERFFLVFV
jgi:hypothetical protein